MPDYGRNRSESASPEPRSLPPQPTPFVGRSEELSEIAHLLAEHSCRLLTLFGPGGVGKTRLAVEVARRLENAPVDGIAFIPLQGVQPDYLASAIADRAGVPPREQQDPRVQLLAHLREREMLLVLDSFEHMLAPGAILLPEILHAAPKIRFLVTSREVLNLREEWLYAVRGLEVPTSLADGDVIGFSAAQLFAERARHVRHDFSLEDESAGVVRICQLVEGMPLALELAASWLTTLRCGEIAAEIHRHLDFLSTHLRDVPEEHRSMRAVFDHSWNMLTDEEQQVFPRLSVFEGGFQLEAAQEVAGASLEILSRLVDKSLLRHEPSGRYQIHELLCQYAAGKLAVSPEAVDGTLDRHCAYYAGFMQRRRPGIDRGRERVREIEVELENVRASWRWSIAHGNVDAIDQTATTWFYFCQIQSRYREGESILAAAVDSLEQQAPSPERDLTLAKVLDAQGWLCIRLGKLDRARQVLLRSLDLYTQLGVTPEPGMGTDPRTALGVLATAQGDYDRAMQLGQEAQRASEASGDAWNMMFASYVLAGAALARGQLEAAGRYAWQGYDTARGLDARWFVAYVLNQLGGVARALGNYEEARQHYRQSYDLRREFDDPEGMAGALNHLGQVTLLQGDDAEATRLYGQSEAIYREIGDRGGLAAALDGLGCAACFRGDLEDAARHIHDALEIAHGSHLLPLTLSILVSAGQVWLHDDRPARAVELLSLVIRHPASQGDAVAQARQLLHRCLSRVPLGDRGVAAQNAKGIAATAVVDGAFGDAMTVNTDQVVTITLALLSALAQEMARPVSARTDEQQLVEPLTPRELEVLELIAAGLTNREVADELVLAVGTVKWYTGQIYGKLGVSSRTQALARARALSILEP